MIQKITPGAWPARSHSAGKISRTMFFLAAFGACTNATAGTPSYIGPYSYSVDRIWYVEPGGYVAGYPTAESALSASLAGLNANPQHACNLRWGNYRSDWKANPDRMPVEGVETYAYRTIDLLYDFEGSTRCYAEYPRSAPTFVRRVRTVCSSTQRFLDNKCVNITAATIRGKKPSNLGPVAPSVGDPINPSNGNMWHIERDYAPAAATNPLTLRRTYNSLRTPWEPGATRSFGAGWTHPYDVTLRQELPSLTFTSHACWKRLDTNQIFCDYIQPEPRTIPDAVSILRPDGKKYIFNRVVDVWVGDADANDRISATFNDDRSAVTEWTYVSAQDQSAERYSATGLLLSITSRNGEVQRMTYSSAANSNDTGPARYPAEAPACPLLQGSDIPAPGLLMCVTDHRGRQLQFKYDASNRIVEAIDPGAQSYVYEYDGATANLTKVSYPDGRSRSYLYNEASRINGGLACTVAPAQGNGLGHLTHAMTGVIDENGDRYLSWNYDCDGKAVQSELGNGVRKAALKYSITSGGTTTNPIISNVATVTYTIGDPAAPQAITRTYSGTEVLGVFKNKSVSALCLECGSVKARTYDANGNVASSTGFTGTVTTYAYGSRNLEIRRTEASGTTLARTVSTSWHPTFRLPLQVAEPRRLTTFTYDASGNVLTRTEQATSDPSGSTGFDAAPAGSPRVWTYTYNAIGQVLTMTGPRTDLLEQTVYQYDDNGNLATVTNAVGHVTTLSNYDPHGRVGRIVAPNGTTTDLVYNARGWVTSRTVTADGVAQATGFEHDGVGQMKKVTLPDGTSLVYTYDEAHRLTGIADNRGNAIAYTLDLSGNRIREEVKDPGGTLTRQIARLYDATNRLQQQTGGAQ